MLKYESDIDFATDTTPSWNTNTYESVNTVPADHTYINDHDADIVANNKSFNFEKSKKGSFALLFM